jgi:restriction endonuclease S subunit
MQVDPQKWLPKFVKYWIMSPMAVKYIRRHTKGTSPSVQKIDQRALINMPFPNHVPINLQKRWEDYLNSMFDRVEQIESLQKQYPDIESLGPSFIAAAFKGKL